MPKPLPTFAFVDGGPHCQPCPQNRYGRRFITYEGTGANGLALVGDSPWMQEIAAGKPFVGPAGGVLNHILSRAGLERADCLITNGGTWCQPRHLGWTDHPERFPEAIEAMNCCRPYLDDLLARFKPKCIVALGNVALRRLAGVWGLKHRHAYVHQTAYGPVVPTFHPSFILQGNFNYSGAVKFALERALEVISGKHKEPEIEALLLDPAPDQLRAYLAGELNELVVDIETPETEHLDEEESEEATFTIVRCGVSISPTTAASFPWTEPFITTFKEAARRAKDVIFWNERFDVPRLQAAGVELRGRIIDGMDAWHFLQSDLPKALGFVAPFFWSGPPWKHLSAAEPARYNALDCLITFLCWRGIQAALSRQNRWDAFETHCLDTKPILVRMGHSPMLVDREQQAAFKVRLEQEYQEAHAKLQEVVPDAVKPVKVWKRPPKKMEGVSVKEVECECRADLVFEDVEDAPQNPAPDA